MLPDKVFSWPTTIPVTVLHWTWPKSFRTSLQFWLYLWTTIQAIKHECNGQVWLFQLTYFFEAIPVNIFHRSIGQPAIQWTIKIVWAKSIIIYHSLPWIKMHHSLLSQSGKCKRTYWSDSRSANDTSITLHKPHLDGFLQKRQNITCKVLQYSIWIYYR